MSRRPAVAVEELERLGWRRIDSRRSKCDAVWRHRSGFAVVHCGHPTAHRPWYVVDPAGELATTLKFQRLADAAGWVLELAPAEPAAAVELLEGLGFWRLEELQDKTQH